MRSRFAAAIATAAVVVVSGCGGSNVRRAIDAHPVQLRAVSAELAMPHGETTWHAIVELPGHVVSVYIGATAIPRAPSVACVGDQLAASYRPSAAGVTVLIDDARRSCASVPAASPIVGGYGVTGYVGEWLPVAVMYR